VIQIAAPHGCTPIYHREVQYVTTYYYVREDGDRGGGARVTTTTTKSQNRSTTTQHQPGHVIISFVEFAKENKIFLSKSDGGRLVGNFLPKVQNTTELDQFVQNSLKFASVESKVWFTLF
jgi:hypothetical protein